MPDFKVVPDAVDAFVVEFKLFGVIPIFRFSKTLNKSKFRKSIESGLKEEVKKELLGDRIFKEEIRDGALMEINKAFNRQTGRR